tara:strand:- start:384 stop:1493 length:1110 start_codon:yes stop_codon:yes gene_type:complete
MSSIEKVLIAGIKSNNKNRMNSQTSIQELEELVKSVDAKVVGKITQSLKNPTTHYLGKGKIEEIINLKKTTNFNTLICNDELSPSQQKNLEQKLDPIKVIDRTALILDLFAKNARTKEGRLQVELAQHEYLLPRIAGQWSHLERLGGGIGTRGPGETQIETDRRLIRNRIKVIKSQIEKVRKHRKNYRKNRNRSGFLTASIIGYTNAGKSQLLNILTNSNIDSQNKLFSTLDPTTRKLSGKYNINKNILLSDTVGFIDKLPTTLVAAFRATLEEISDANIIIHLIDISDKEFSNKFETSNRILADLGYDKKPTLIVLNKIDKFENWDDKTAKIDSNTNETTFISALKETNIEDLILKLTYLADKIDRVD